MLILSSLRDELQGDHVISKPCHRWIRSLLLCHCLLRCAHKSLSVPLLDEQIDGCKMQRAGNDYQHVEDLMVPKHLWTGVRPSHGVYERPNAV